MASRKSGFVKDEMEHDPFSYGNQQHIKLAGCLAVVGLVVNAGIFQIPYLKFPDGRFLCVGVQEKGLSIQFPHGDHNASGQGVGLGQNHMGIGDGYLGMDKPLGTKILHYGCKVNVDITG